MKKIIVLTSMRTGSTWLTFLVKNLSHKRAGFATIFEEIDAIWKHDAIVKAHRFTTEEMFDRYPDAYILTSVRNPKGRTSSQFYFLKPHNEERLNKVLKRNTKVGEQRQLDRMWKGFSSRNLEVDREPHYMWTTFEWMKEDIYKEAKYICDFLEITKSERHLNDAVFKTHRDCVACGIIRKGEVASWKEEYFKERLNTLDKYQQMYYNRINEEIGKEKPYD